MSLMSLMSTHARNALLCGLAALTASCSDGGQSGEPVAQRFGEARSELSRQLAPDVSEAELATQAEGNRAFALDMYGELVAEHPEQGLFFSPYSISVAFAMTYAGAAGTTAEEMAMALHFELEEPTLHHAFNAVDLALASRGRDAGGRDGEPFRLHVLNSIWGREDETYPEPFLDTLAVSYGAGLRLVDFGGAPDESRMIINDWVEEQTEDRVEELLPAGTIDAATRLVLVNAIYFNAAWEKKFQNSATDEGDFTTLDESVVRVPMMHITEELGYYAGAGVQAVEKRYDGGELSMLLIVPEDLEGFEASLTSESLGAILDGLAEQPGSLDMPKWSYDGDSISLVEVLRALGMEEAFTGDADFSRLGGGQITGVFHQAFVAVDETGTEAAAATAVVVGRGADEVDFSLTIDRPFLYLIRDLATDTIVFMGRVTDPS